MDQSIIEWEIEYHGNGIDFIGFILPADTLRLCSNLTFSAAAKARIMHALDNLVETSTLSSSAEMTLERIAV